MTEQHHSEQPEHTPAPQYLPPQNATTPPAPVAPQQPVAPATSTGTNILAILSLVAAFVFPLAAIILGHIGLSQIKKTGEQGRGLALAGTICGYVFTAIGLLIIVVYVIFFVVLLGSTPSYMY